jgi:hypothetical protein
VCRTAFAFVVTMMDAGLETTPYEEIPNVNAAPSAAVVDVQPSASSSEAAPERSKATQVKFGKSKGKHLCDIDERDLEWQLAAARKSVEARDPKWHASNEAWLRTVEAEVARRSA